MLNPLEQWFARLYFHGQKYLDFRVPLQIFDDVDFGNTKRFPYLEKANAAVVQQTICRLVAYATQHLSKLINIYYIWISGKHFLFHTLMSPHLHICCGGLK